MFQENLKTIVENVDGAIAGLLMGFDGIAVETYTRTAPGDEVFDINTVGMEFSYILTQVRKAAEALEVGGVDEVAVRTERLSIIIRVLSADYFLALAMGQSGNFGKGRYLMRVTAPKLQAEL